MGKILTWKLSKEQAGKKLLDVLQEFLDSSQSRRSLKRWIEENAASINAYLEPKASRLLQEGDILEFAYPQEEIEREYRKRFVWEEEAIVYRDEDVLLYNKRAGISSEDLARLQDSFQLMHRLDKGTSGLLLLAKKQHLPFFIDQFKQKRVHKQYLALVSPCPRKREGIIEQSISRTKQQGRWCIDERGGAWAKSSWRILEKKASVALLSCIPLTGRTHQLRLHLAFLGISLIGDATYSPKQSVHFSAKRPLLHAHSLSFPHPNKDRLSFECDLPLDFSMILKQEGLKWPQKKS